MTLMVRNCGLINVNIGTSGAEIVEHSGGEKGPVGTRVRLGCVAQLHATGHEHGQFSGSVTASPRRRIQRVTRDAP